MGRYTQANRPMRVDTVLPEDDLLFDRLQGTEGISTPFGFELEMLSEKPDIDPLSLLRSAMRVTLVQPDGTLRRIHGLVRRFVQLGQDEDLTSYRAELVPWFWFLSLSRESRIYQDMSVLEIVEQVFKDQQYSDFEIRTSGTYPKREYCVQYRETHLAFVSRLLEEEGIFYFFEHSEERHLLVIADGNDAAAPCPGAERVRIHHLSPLDEDVVTGLHREHAVHLGKVTFRDYDYLKPQLTLASTITADSPEEHYDYPGGFATLEEGDRYARLQLEREEAPRQVVRGEGTCRGFCSGFTFELEEHYRADLNVKYLLLGVEHTAYGGSYRAWGSDEPMRYTNRFTAIPADTPFRPEVRTRKPRIHGVQTALVVGKKGEEVWVDKHGRIKVQFYWDRQGKKDENSSCWIRVATPWAGKAWGAVSIPRLLNEVVVTFLEGDPDRPLVVGSVYNADQTPPFALPDSGVQEGMKTRSSKGGGGFNEISLTDKKGKELINTHAQKDRSASIGHDDSISVANDRSMSVNGKLTETVKKDMSLTITEGNYSHAVAKGKADITVKKDITVYGDAAIAETAKAAYAITSKTAAITITASTSIKLVVGSSSIEMDSGGKITIKGKSILIDGSDDATVTGKKIALTGGQEVKAGVGSQQVTCDVAKVNVSGASINASAVGTHTIAGAVVKIN